MKIKKLQAAGLIPKIGETIKVITNKGTKYIKPLAERYSVTVENVNKALKEAQQYKQSQGYKDLVQMTSQEMNKLGYYFPVSTFYGSIKPTPLIQWTDLSIDDSLGMYDYNTNTIKLDPKNFIGIEAIGTPFHEGLHWQRIGIPNLLTSKQNEAFRSYLNKKLNIALHNTAIPYLRTNGELQVNGLEAGRMIGLNYFEPYPGYVIAKDAIHNAQEYNSYLKGVRSNTDKEAQNFWKILTGNYIPSVTGISVLGASALKNKNK